MPISQITLLMEVVFPSLGNLFLTNPLLQPVATDFLFSGNNILSFTCFSKPLLLLEGGQYLKKVLLLLQETVFFLLFFFRYLFEWK